MILFTATLPPFSSRILSLSVRTYLKALHLLFLLSHPRRSILPSRRPSFLTHDAPSLSFPPPRSPSAYPSILPLYLPPTLCPARREPSSPSTLAHTRFLRLSPLERSATTQSRQRGSDREEGEGGRGNERANGGAGSLRSCATRTSQPRATVARLPRCPLKGSSASTISRLPSRVPRGISPPGPCPSLALGGAAREHRALSAVRTSRQEWASKRTAVVSRQRHTPTDRTNQPTKYRRSLDEEAQSRAILSSTLVRVSLRQRSPQLSSAKGPMARGEPEPVVALARPACDSRARIVGMRRGS